MGGRDPWARGPATYGEQQGATGGGHRVRWLEAARERRPEAAASTGSTGEAAGGGGRARVSTEAAQGGHERKR